jgi:flagellar biosynthesis protein FlhG
MSRVAHIRRAQGALAVTGSKGGVGKTNLVANLAVALARWGRRVLVVDGDLGLSNLDVLLGLIPKRTIEHVVRGDAALADVLVEGPAGIRILPAASGIPELASLDGATRARLLTALAEGLELVDDLLIDTGAGLGETTLALQLAASRILLVTTPEPTSLVDAYATLKVLWSAEPTKPVDVVVNAAADDGDARGAYEQVARAARHFLGREPGWLGAVHRDPKLVEAVRRQRCVLELYPDAPASRCYEQLALRLALSPDCGPPSFDYWQRLLPAGREERPH